MNSTDSTVVQSLAPSNVDILRSQIENLQLALQEQSPSYESLLHTIHRNLAKDESTVHFLTDEEIGVICAGLSKRTGVFITAEVVEKVKKGNKKVGVSDLM